MLLQAVPGTLAAAVLLLAPGVLWAWWCYPAAERATRLAIGLGVGLVFQLHLCGLLAAGPGITRQSVALATLGGYALAGLLIWRMRHPRPRPLTRPRRRAALQLGALVVLVVLVRLIPLAFQTVPQGWDPSFHSLLASTTVATGRLPTWSPFEPIPSNYPYGPHVLIAEISLLTGLAPHQVFAGLLDGFVPLLTGLGLYALALRLLRSHAAAMGAVAAYSFLGFWGSIDYGSWGGLPNALGCSLLIVCLAVLFAPGSARTRIVVGGLLLGAIPIAHHHVMLATLLLLVPYGAYLLLRAAVRFGGDAGRRQAVRAFTRLILTGGVGLVTVAYWAIPFALRISELAGTSTLRYYDVDPGILFAANGAVLWLLALSGFAIFWLHRSGGNRPAPTVREARTFLAIGSGMLLLAFVLGYYGYRAYSLYRYQQPYTAFTPSRFLTDLTLFLGIYAGKPLADLWQMGARVSHKAVALTGAHTAALVGVLRLGVRAALVGVLLATAATSLLPQLAPLHPAAGRLMPGEADAFAWIRARTPRDTLVMNLDPTARWAPYFTQREVWTTPVPISEYTAGYVVEKRYLGQVLLDLLQQRAASGTQVIGAISAGTALPALEQRPVAFLSLAPIPGLTGRPAFTAGPEHVYLLAHGFSLLLPAPARQVAITAQWRPADFSIPAAEWAAPDGTAGGWRSGAPPHTGPVFLRLTIPEAVGAGARVTCNAEHVALLFVDGQPVPGGCSGQEVALPELARPGPHVVAAQVVLDATLGNWFDLTLTAPKQGEAGRTAA